MQSGFANMNLNRRQLRVGVWVGVSQRILVKIRLTILWEFNPIPTPANATIFLLRIDPECVSIFSTTPGIYAQLTFHCIITLIKMRIFTAIGNINCLYARYTKTEWIIHLFFVYKFIHGIISCNSSFMEITGSFSEEFNIHKAMLVCLPGHVVLTGHLFFMIGLSGFWHEHLHLSVQSLSALQSVKIQTTCFLRKH